MSTIIVRGSYGLIELPAGEELTACCGRRTFYSDEHQNFYCSKCRKGQGHAYYERNCTSQADQS